MTNSLWVTCDIAHFVKGSLITSFPSMTNSWWVTLHILWKAVSSQLFLWPTVCEWHCKFCEKQFHHIFVYNQQEVSVIAHVVKGNLIISVCKMHRKWVIVHILWKAGSLHLFPWWTESEWHCTFCEMQSHYLFSYDQQQVSNIAHFVKGKFITSFPTTTGSECHCTCCER